MGGCMLDRSDGWGKAEKESTWSFPRSASSFYFIWEEIHASDKSSRQGKDVVLIPLQGRVTDGSSFPPSGDQSNRGDVWGGLCSRHAQIRRYNSLEKGDQLEGDFHGPGVRCWGQWWWNTERERTQNKRFHKKNNRPWNQIKSGARTNEDIKILTFQIWSE